LVVFGFITKPPTMIRLFAELSGHYRRPQIESAPGRPTTSAFIGRHTKHRDLL
jgi:hypothetical protein